MNNRIDDYEPGFDPSDDEEEEGASYIELLIQLQHTLGHIAAMYSMHHEDISLSSVIGDVWKAQDLVESLLPGDVSLNNVN